MIRRSRKTFSSAPADPDLEQLLKIKESVESLSVRLDAIDGTFSDVAEESPKDEHHIATAGDFFTGEQLAAIDRDYRDALRKGSDCDALDYALSSITGVACGLIDFLFTSNPHQGAVSNSVDDLFDNLVIRFAQHTKGKNGKHWNPKAGNERNVASAIGFLERNFSVNYDQATSSAVGQAVAHMSASNHHAKSLAHQPDLIGLIASISCQFTGTSTFIDGSRSSGSHSHIVIVSGTDSGIELVGSSLQEKIFSGTVNWLAHCMSDIAGSSGSRGAGAGHFGAGLPLPFTEFVQFCDFGKFPNEKGEWQSFATVMTQVYEQGYDARHGMATALPVMLNEMLIRVIFVLKQHFYAKKSWKESLPLGMNYTLQRMLTVGFGSMCAVDFASSALTSGGNWVVF